MRMDECFIASWEMRDADNRFSNIGASQVQHLVSKISIITCLNHLYCLLVFTASHWYMHGIGELHWVAGANASIDGQYGSWDGGVALIAIMFAQHILLAHPKLTSESRTLTRPNFTQCHWRCVKIPTVTNWNLNQSKDHISRWSSLVRMLMDPPFNQRMRPKKPPKRNSGHISRPIFL